MAVHTTIALCCFLISGVGASAPAQVETEITSFEAADAWMGDRFGLSMVSNGERLIVGADWNDDRGTNSGSAYVFDISNGSNPIQRRKLVGSTIDRQDWYGASIAIDGNIVAVGAAGHLWPDSGNASEWVFLYDVSDPINVVELSAIRASDFRTFSGFGSSVALDGNTLLVTSSPTGPGGNRGVYVFDITDPSNPIEVGMLQGETILEHTAMQGDLVLGGRWNNSDFGTRAGAAYLFDVTDMAAPVHLSTFYSPNPSPYADFGISIAMSGDLAVVGAPGEGATVEDSGRAYLFDISDPLNPALLSTLAPVVAHASHTFGGSVAIEGNTVVVGAYRRQSHDPSLPSVYVYDIADPTQPVETRRYGISLDISEYGVSSLAISGDRVYVGAPRLGDGGIGFVYSTLAICDGDVNEDSSVDVNDISYVLFRLGDPGSAGDANGDGSVDVNDISYVLFRLGDPC